MHVNIATWNVLHRIHAENWGELPALLQIPESERNLAIAQRVWAGGWQVVCLQEVSGDQLATLRGTAPAGVEVFAFTYPRIPRLRNPAAAPTLATPTDCGARVSGRYEHLVTLVAGAGARMLSAAAFPSDPGKGFLSVVLGSGLVVVNTHVTYGAAAAAQLAMVAAEARQTAGMAVICGDFNAAAPEVSAGLGADFVFGQVPAGSLPTRPRRDGRSKSQDIDHIIAWRGTVDALQVWDAAGLSDHNLVAATLRRPVEPAH